MQKKNLLFAAGLMLLAACSEDIQPGTSDNGGLNLTGEGEMLVELKFNNASGTRAEDDGFGGFGGYEDGTGDESEVKDATFYFFKKTGGAYLGSSGKITITGATPNENKAEHIESNVAVTVPGLVVDALHDSEGEVKVIVVLNRDKDFTEPTSGQTYESFRTKINTGNGSLSFMMTNSVYYTGSNNDDPWADASFDDNIENSIGTVTKDNVYEKGTAAKDKKVFTVYVERVCSKVTFAVNGANNSFDIKDAEDNTAVQGTITVKAWGLNILNTKYYPVKQLADMFAYGDGGDYSSWPAKKLKWNVPRHYRSFWAVDPNYSGDGSYLKTDFTETPFSNLEKLATTGTNALYCLENTFSNKGQDQDETTSVVVLAQFLLKSATAPVNVVAYGSKGDIPVYYSEDDFLKKALADKLKDTYYTTTDEPKEPLEASDFELKAVSSEETVLGPAASGTPATETIGYKSALKIALRDEVKTVYDAGGNVKDKEKLITELTKDLSEYTVYVNGYCYYSVPIRHFADSEVPLMNSTDINKNSQLGRYGIVRNHVYNVNINSIKALGKPVTDNTSEVPEEPDDKFEFLMDASINVLSWAVRNQNVDL